MSCIRALGRHVACLIVLELVSALFLSDPWGPILSRIAELALAAALLLTLVQVCLGDAAPGFLWGLGQKLMSMVLVLAGIFWALSYSLERLFGWAA